MNKGAWMQSVLCYGDSNTFGQTTADTPQQRFGPHVRWPGVMRAKLGETWLVIEEGLSGRTTVNDDPVEGAEKNGRTYLKPCLDSHRPLDVIILMLGTNDLKIRFNKPVGEIAMGVSALIGDIKQVAPGRDAEVPQIILVSPPPILEDLRGWESVFQGGYEKSLRLAEEYANVAEVHGVAFFDAGSVAKSSQTDGFHLDVESHKALGLALADEVESVFAR